MKFSDNKGFALVTSLMLTLISLTVVLSLLYLITQSIQLSGLNKKYKTALEASYGGTEIFTKDILPFVMRNYSSASMTTELQANFAAVGLQVVTSQNCLQAKLTKSTSDWPAACNKSLSPKDSPDIRYSMQAAAAGGNPFNVYSKIVDTTNGNTDISGLQLEGAGVAEAQSVLSPQHFPYIYRIEIQGERSTNATAQANLEVLYAY